MPDTFTPPPFVPTPTPTSMQMPTPPPSSQKKLSPRGVQVIVAISLAVFLIPAAIFFWPEYQRSQLIENGLPAEATILEIRPTGSTYNDQPQVRIRLEVRPEGGAAYAAETEMIINPVYLPQFQPGKIVRVRYDADDPSKVAIEETASGLR